MTIPKNYTAKFSLVRGKGKVPEETWRNFKSNIANLAAKYNLNFGEESKRRVFYISADYQNRDKVSNALTSIYCMLKDYAIPVQKARINVLENSFVLEDLISQAETLLPEDIIIDDFYIYYLTPHDMHRIRQGHITNNLELFRHRKYAGTKNYGRPVNAKKTIPEIRDLIGKLKSERRLGLVTSIEMLRNCERIVYLGPFAGFHGNYKTQLTIQIHYERIDTPIVIDDDLEKHQRQILLMS